MKYRAISEPMIVAIVIIFLFFLVGEKICRVVRIINTREKSPI